MLSTQTLQEETAVWEIEYGKLDVAKLTFFVFLLLHIIFHCPFTQALIKLLILKRRVLCPYRRARYWRCARRRQRKASQKENSDYCSWMRCCNKLQLPPPLPYRKRTRPKDTTPPEDQNQILDDETMTADYKKKQTTLKESPTVQQGGNVRLDVQPSKMYRTRSLSVRLIDLVRMQQWQAILDRPIKRKDAKFRDADGLYSLHWAAAGGAPIPVLQALLDAYPSAIHKTDNEGSLPLHFAAHYSASLNTVELLLRFYPAAVRAQDKYGRTPTYHAAEKSAKLDVLKLLVKEDPSTITTPCFMVSNKTKMSRISTQFENKDLSSMTRSQAILTPLYLVWNDVVFDHKSRTKRTGKKWEKAVWMLQQAYQHHTGRADDNLLLASINMDIFLPEQVVSIIVAAYPELLRVPDSVHGNLPLASAALAFTSSHKFVSYRLQAILEMLLEAYPLAATHRNEQGRSALWEAAATGKVGWTFLEKLLKLAPEALEYHDKETKLPLAMYAAATSFTATSNPLSQSSPEVEEPGSSAHSNIRELLDPFHLLTDKQYDLLFQENEKIQPFDAHAQESGDHHRHLTAIYGLLQANPSQIIFRS